MRVSGSVYQPSFICTNLAVVISILPLSAQAVESDALRQQRETRQKTVTTASTRLDTVVVTGRSLFKSSEASGGYTVPLTGIATGLPMSSRATPQSVSTTTQQELKDFDIQSSGEALSRMAGVSMLRADSNRTSYSARGFAINNFEFDGLLSPTNRFWNFGETDFNPIIYDRVELIRGATGLMTGSGDPSALVNFIRKRPTPMPSLIITGSAGRYDNYDASIDASTPLTTDGRIKGRFIAARDHGYSFLDYQHNRRDTLYAIVTSELTSSTDLDVGIEYQRHQTDGAGGSNPMFHADGSRTHYPRSTNFIAPWSHFFNEMTTGFVDLKQTFDNGWNTRAAYSYSDSNYGLRYLWLSGYPDRAKGLGTNGSPLYYRGNRHTQTVNLNANGPFELFGQTHEATLGWMQTSDDYGMGLYSALQVFDYSNIPFPSKQPLPQPEWSKLLRHIDDYHMKQNGTYAAGRFTLIEPLKLIVGARLSNWKIDQNYYGSLNQYHYHDEFSPYAGLTWHLTDSTTAYTSYTEIFQHQSGRTPDGKLLDPITGKNIEVGIKQDIRDNLQASLAIFQVEENNVGRDIPGVSVQGRADQQAQRPVDGRKTKGAELQLTGELLPQWLVNGSLTLANAREASGERANTTHPRRQFKLATNYQLPAPLQQLTMGTAMRIRSKTYRTAKGPDGENIKAINSGYSLYDAMARYNINEHLTAQLNVKNLFNKRYYEQLGFYNQYYLGEPRTARLSLEYRL